MIDENFSELIERARSAMQGRDQDIAKLEKRVEALEKMIATSEVPIVRRLLERVEELERIVQSQIGRASCRERV